MRLFTFLFMAPLWAAPSAEIEGHGASITQLIFPLINFLIFLYLVNRFLLPQAKDYFRSRREEIASAVRGAGEEKRKAEEKVHDLRERLARLAADAKRLREELRTEGEREKVRMLAEAGDLAKKIKADAAFLAEQEIKIARQQIRSEIARLSQEAAQKALQRHLTPADQKRLLEDFLTELREAK
ncbi:MAG TPA: ATP synthase F0 subunit B [Candidatus Binatia bacterium]|nr:ATP synthase F0 subunit B [Candidatus Binatia bacterium]